MTAASTVKQLPEQKILTPTLVSDLIQANFDNYIGTIMVEGEITGFLTANSGHTYLQLKDKKSLLKGVIWRYNMTKSGASAVQNGMDVLAKGRLTVYAPRGEYQLIIERIMPKGEGALSRAFEILKKKLETEGLFNPERKRSLPVVPVRVALLAASGSAAYSDFVQTAFKRCAGAWISLFSTRVQGKGAAEEMAEALELLNTWGGFDLVVMTRGGGSLEDLWSYNEEVLVRAVANSRIPVLAAIGHSTDLSLVEMAADHKAITPTAAAETVFPSDIERLDVLGGLLNHLKMVTKGRLQAKKSELQQNIAHLGSFKYRLNQFAQTLDSRLMSLENSVSKLLASSRSQLEALTRALEYKSPRRDQAMKRQALEILVKDLLANAKNLITTRQNGLNWQINALELVSPLSILTRGYAVVTDDQGRVVRSASQTRPGQNLGLRLAEGHLTAKVIDTYSGPSRPDHEEQGHQGD
jgi:exodeoxyribonuclease VII large subunit